MLIAAQLREGRQDERVERLERLVAALKQAAFGRKSERSDPDEFDLALEDLETAIAAIHAEEEADAKKEDWGIKKSYWPCIDWTNRRGGLSATSPGLI